MSLVKAFEQDLYDKYDASAKAAVAKFIESLGFQALPNPDRYGVDLLLFNNGNGIGIAEVEVRQWSPRCPFPTIHVPERKTKFFNGNALFFALTHDLKHCYWIKASEILKHPIKEVRNVKVTSGEYFFDVPTEAFNFEELQ